MILNKIKKIPQGDFFYFIQKVLFFVIGRT